MDGALLHLWLNHVPVLGIPFSAALTFAGVLRRDASLTKVGLWAFVLAGLSALPAYFSGAEAEMVASSLNGVGTDHVLEHTRLAQKSLNASLAVAALALAFLVHAAWRKSLWEPAGAVILAAAVPAVGMLSYTAYLGRLIRHQELHEKARPIAAEAEGNS